MAGNLNRALLIGLVGTPPTLDDHGWRFTLAIAGESDGRVHVERVDVAGDSHLAGAVRALRSAQLVYVEGRLERGLRGAVIRAHQLVPLGDPPPPPAAEAPALGTHASPRPHDRAGHPRVIHRDTPRERVVWVRSTHVGGDSAGVGAGTATPPE